MQGTAYPVQLVNNECFDAPVFDILRKSGKLRTVDVLPTVSLVRIDAAFSIGKTTAKLYLCFYRNAVLFVDALYT